MYINTYQTKEVFKSDYPAIVFVHGLFHGSWCWQKTFVPYFEKKGFNCFSFDLRGHGTSEGKEQLNKFNLDDYVNDLSSIIQRTNGKIVLIGHSMGSALVERYIQKNKIDLGVLLTPPPLTGAMPAFSRLGKKVGRLNLLKFALFKDPYIVIKNPKVSKLMFFTDKLSDDEYQTYYNLLGQESYKVCMELTKPFIEGELNPLKVPLLLIGANQDGFFTREETDDVGKKYGINPIYFNGGHDLMLEENWSEVADAIFGWIVSQGIIKA
jgi:pimeloyl-ACP methyl ester carboxylesterase